jgi:cell division inhibitor SepF
VIGRLKSWLGLGEHHDDYDDEEYYDDDAEEAAPSYTSPYGGESSVKVVDRRPDVDRARGARSGSGSRGSFDSMASRFDDRGGRPAEYEPPARASWDREQAAPVSSISAPQVKMHIVEPRAFSEAQAIADKFKLGTPVIMNLTGSDADLSKRLLDFASGLTYGLEGGLQKVSDKVFMLTPRNVDVSAEDRRRLKDKGLFTID